jgi:hypothetical protein
LCEECYKKAYWLFTGSVVFDFITKEQLYMNNPYRRELLASIGGMHPPRTSRRNHPLSRHAK